MHSPEAQSAFVPIRRKIDDDAMPRDREDDLHHPERDHARSENEQGAPVGALL